MDFNAIFIKAIRGDVVIDHVVVWRGRRTNPRKVRRNKLGRHLWRFSGLCFKQSRSRSRNNIWLVLAGLSLTSFYAPASRRYLCYYAPLQTERFMVHQSNYTRERMNSEARILFPLSLSLSLSLSMRRAPRYTKARKIRARVILMHDNEFRDSFASFLGQHIRRRRFPRFIRRRRSIEFRVTMASKRRQRSRLDIDR
jgi:hypothetical protein